MPFDLPSWLQPWLAYIQANEFASGMLFTGGIGAILVMARQYPMRAGRWLFSRFVYSADVRSMDDAFDWVTLWLDRHPYSRRARSVVVSASHSSGSGGMTATSSSSPGVGRREPLRPVVFTPANGKHLLWHQGRLVWLERAEKETKDGDGYRWPRETYTIRVLGRGQKAIRALLDEAQALAAGEKEEREIGIYVPRYGDWHRLESRQQRPLSSVILPGGEKDRVESDLRRFLSERGFYRDHGIPWRRGYLFHGVPGTGKTSLIAALAGEVGFDLHCLNLANRTLNDETLTALLLSMTPRSALLLEDVDATAPDRPEKGREDAPGVTFSGVLNALDGVATKDGLVVFLTTNHRERLDPALIRKGRVNLEMEFRHATVEQLVALHRSFFPGVGPLAAEHWAATRHGPLTMSEAQEILMEYRARGETWSTGAVATESVLRPLPLRVRSS